MKGSTAWAHWKNAVEGLESAEILLRVRATISS